MKRKSLNIMSAIVLVLLMLFVSAPELFASAEIIVEVEVGPPPTNTSLKGIPVPTPGPGFHLYVVDEKKAVILGKALFWDTQVGSDRATACATCHYHAGVDNRFINTVNPGADEVFEVVPGPGPQMRLKKGEFPFKEFPKNDVVGSQGVETKEFVAVNPFKGGRDEGDKIPNPIFGKRRQVTGRNAPTVINAVFNHRNFADGRATNLFNGKNPFGTRDPAPAPVYTVRNGVLMQEYPLIANSAMASQSTGPPTSNVEMSWIGRNFSDLGKKMLFKKALATQDIANDDSVLGDLVHPRKKGLTKTYRELIMEAFHPMLWDYRFIIDTPDGKYKIMEANFSLFWGLAIMAYESTLVSDDSKFDRVKTGQEQFTAQEKLGQELFAGKGKCINCHSGPLFHKATVTNIDESLGEGAVERMLMGNEGVALYDNAFYNIGVRPSDDDVGLGGVDPYDNPLSLAELFLNKLSGEPTPLAMFNNVKPCTFEAKFSTDVARNCEPLNVAEEDLTLAVKGAFKTPTLRNVELTGPYFHTGGYLSLREVIEFYNRGGNFPENPELAPDIKELNLSDVEMDALEVYLKTLTDERVRWEKAPFDHPSMLLPNGNSLLAVGKNGAAQPLKAFEDHPEFKK